MAGLRCCSLQACSRGKSLLGFLEHGPAGRGGVEANGRAGCCDQTLFRPAANPGRGAVPHDGAGAPCCIPQQHPHRHDLHAGGAGLGLGEQAAYLAFQAFDSAQLCSDHSGTCALIGTDTNLTEGRLERIRLFRTGVGRRALRHCGQPWWLLVATYAMTITLAMVITSNAAAVLMFPIASAAIQDSWYDFMSFAIASTVGASAEFATPIGY